MPFLLFDEQVLAVHVGIHIVRIFVGQAFFQCAVFFGRQRVRTHIVARSDVATHVRHTCRKGANLMGAPAGRIVAAKIASSRNSEYSPALGALVFFELSHRATLSPTWMYENSYTNGRKVREQLERISGKLVLCEYGRRGIVKLLIASVLALLFLPPMIASAQEGGSRGGCVHVGGYTGVDDMYVHDHYRSASDVAGTSGNSRKRLGASSNSNFYKELGPLENDQDSLSALIGTAQSPSKPGRESVVTVTDEGIARCH